MPVIVAEPGADAHNVPMVMVEVAAVAVVGTLDMQLNDATFPVVGLKDLDLKLADVEVVVVAVMTALYPIHL